MKLTRWYALLTILLVFLSLALYLAQALIFRQPRDTLFYLFQDLAFLPIQVLLVTMILSDLLARREKRALLNKMNMAIGAFFGEMGSELISRLKGFDRQSAVSQATLALGADWGPNRFARARRELAAASPDIDPRAGDLVAVRDFLMAKRPFLLSLLENQNLLEHQSFTDLLWAASHLAEELKLRADIHALPDNDLEHLAGDTRRVYSLLLAEWLNYAAHLQKAYPYMYSLVVRNNPLAPEARVIFE